MFNRSLVLLFFILTKSLQATTENKTEALQLVSPYLLPHHHPVKSKLDCIFKQSRVLLSIQSMKKAGFTPVEPRKFTRLIVTSHPQLTGYILKVYLDSQRNHKDRPEYVCWAKRVEGAQLIQKIINENGWNHLFKVPKQWIYALPSKPTAPKDFNSRNFVLVEENMGLLSARENKKMWASGKITKELLSALFAILAQVGLRDCCKIDNIPFSSDGRIAFIDTQTFNEGIPPYRRLTSSLRKDLREYWKSLKP